MLGWMVMGLNPHNNKDLNVPGYERFPKVTYLPKLLNTSQSICVSEGRHNEWHEEISREI